MELHRDHFQNYKRYNIPKAQLIIADIPYNIGINAYASNPSWYKDGDNKNGESALAGKGFFDTDKDFRIAEFMHFVSTMLKKEPKEKGQAGCMIVFCEFEQQFMLIEKGKEYGFNNYINLVFRKNYSAQVLKANMKIVGNCEYALLLYRDKLPKFNNNGKMVFNCMDYQRDNETPKIHPTQKSVHVMRNLIEIFTDPGDAGLRCWRRSSWGGSLTASRSRKNLLTDSRGRLPEIFKALFSSRVNRKNIIK